MGGTCTIQPILASTEEPRETVLGDVKLRDQIVVNQTPSGEVVQVRRVEASASFRSLTSTVPSDGVVAYGFCLGRTGRPAVAEATRLDAGTLQVRSASGLEVDLTPDPDLVYTQILQTPWPLGSPSVTVQTPGGQGDAFPGFSVEASAVQPMELRLPSPDEPVTVGPGPLDLAWRPGDGDYVQVELNPVQDPGSNRFGGQILCVFADTGCGQIPEVAVQVALTEPTNEYRLLVSRVRSVRAQLAEDTVLDFELTSRVSLEAGRTGAP